MIKISPILNNTPRLFGTARIAPCATKPLRSDVFQKSPISFAGKKASQVEKINGNPVILETTIEKNGVAKPAYVTIKKTGHAIYLLTLNAEKSEDMQQKDKQFEPLGQLEYSIKDAGEIFATSGGYKEDDRVLYVEILRKTGKLEEYKGIGTTLLKIAYGISKSKGLQGRMTLSACNMNSKINKSHPFDFYRKNGFERCDNGTDIPEDAFIHMYLPEKNMGRLSKGNFGDKLNSKVLSKVEKIQKVKI